MSDVVVSTEIIEERTFLVRGQKVMLDSHLAKLYDVPTKSLNLAVKRNRERFPDDFMFRLTREEYRQFLLRFQIETSKAGKGGRRYLPYVFTEQGVAMLSSVVGSKRAIQVNIAIMSRRDGFATCVCEAARDTFYTQGTCSEAIRTRTEDRKS
jgi:hypothetical protein